MDSNQTSSLEELITLVKYLIGHNESHTKELEELLVELKNRSLPEANRLLKEAIAKYQEGNAILKKALLAIVKK